MAVEKYLYLAHNHLHWPEFEEFILYFELLIGLPVLFSIVVFRNFSGFWGFSFHMVFLGGSVFEEDGFGISGSLFPFYSSSTLAVFYTLLFHTFFVGPLYNIHHSYHSEV